MPADTSVILWNTERQEPEKVPAAAVRGALGSGSHIEYTEGQSVIGGKQDSLLSGSTNRPIDRVLLGESADVNIKPQVDALSEQTREELFGGNSQTLLSGVEGFLDATTMGLIEGEPGFVGEARREVNPNANTAGHLLGILGSVVTPASPIGALGRLSEATKVAMAARLGGRPAAQVAAAAAEGALFGVIDETTHQAFDAVIRDKPFAAERLMSSAAMGSLLGGGLEGVKQMAKAVRSVSPSVRKTEAAVIPQADVDEFVSATADSKRALDDMVDKRASRFRVLTALRKDAEDGLPGVADLPEGQLLRDLDVGWFSEREEAITSAVNAKKKLERASSGSLLDLDARGVKRYAQAWEEYELAVTNLDNMLAQPPAIRRPVSGTAEALEADKVTARGEQTAAGFKPQSSEVSEAEVERLMAKRDDLAFEVDKVRTLKHGGDAAKMEAELQQLGGLAKRREAKLAKEFPGGEEAAKAGGREKDVYKRWKKQSDRLEKTKKQLAELNRQFDLLEQHAAAISQADEAAAKLAAKPKLAPTDGTAEFKAAPNARPPSDTPDAFRVVEGSEVVGDTLSGQVIVPTRRMAPLSESPSGQMPFMRRFLNDWQIEDSLSPRLTNLTDAQLNPLDTAAGRLAANAERLQGINPAVGGVPGATSRFGLDGLLGKSAYLDSVVDAWSSHQYGKLVAKLAADPSTKLPQHLMRRHRWDETMPAPLSGHRQAAELGRYVARREAGGGYAGQMAGQAAFTLIAGKLGMVANWISQGKNSAAAAVESALSGRRVSRLTNIGTALHVSYTGDEEDASSDPKVRIEQLRQITTNEPGVRQRLQQALEPIYKVSPELAMQMEDLQVNRLNNLAARAPAFLAVPGLVPDRPFGAEWDAFQDYEAVTHDPDVAFKALKAGTLTNAQAEALREQHPEHFRFCSEKILEGLTEERIRNMSPAALDQIELCLGYPITPKPSINQQEVYTRMKAKGQEMPGGAANPRGLPAPTMGQQQSAPPHRR